MIKIIAAISKNKVMGKDNALPFNYPEDMRHFKECTLNCSVIMGRNTYESIGKPLPKRKNIVVTSKLIHEVETAANLHEAIHKAYDFNNDIWLIGGASIYKEGMNYAQEIYLTVTPDIIEGDNLIIFPEINLNIFKIKEQQKLGSLDLFIYKKI